MARAPRLVRTRLGAATEDLLAGEVASGAARVIIGSLLSGHRAAGPLAWLGRFHDQVVRTRGQGWGIANQVENPVGARANLQSVVEVHPDHERFQRMEAIRSLT